MEETFNEKLCNTANLLVEMLGDCYNMQTIEYITDVVSNNGYALVDEVNELEEEE